MATLCALLLPALMLGMSAYDAFWLRLLWPHLPVVLPMPTYSQAVALLVVASLLTAQASPKERDDVATFTRFALMGPVGYVLVRVFGALAG